METKRKGKDWLRKHWLPLTVGLLGLVLLVALAVGSIRRYQASTPIARIEPEDSLRPLAPPSRLDRYKEEMERIKRENIRRQRSLETIVSMDFGSLGEGETETEGPAEPPEGEQAAPSVRAKEELPEERRKEAPRKENRNKPERSSSPSGQRMEKEAESAFYTLKVEPFQATRTEGHRGFYRAVVHGDQQVEPNGTLSLRLLEEIREGTHSIPRNSLLYGRLMGTGGGRLKIQITTPGPLRLRVYDQDYQEGILYMQEELLPAALAESRDDALEQLLVSLPYGGVASGLTGLGRNLVRKNRKQKSVFLADGYPVFVGTDEK
jgi:hypothetical protein